MTLKEKIEKDLKEALLRREELTVSVLRMLKSSLLNREKEKRNLVFKKDLSEKEILEKSKLTEEEILEVIRKEIKKRKEAIEEFKKGKREELVEKEEKEIKILEKYLPPSLTKEELEKIIKKKIKEVGAKSQKDIGKVMGEVMKEVKQRADGKEVLEIVKKILTS